MGSTASLIREGTTWEGETEGEEEGEWRKKGKENKVEFC